MLAQGSSPNDDHFRDDNYNDDSGNDHLKMVATVRVITTMKTSRKLGDTVPSWLELFLELVLIPEVIGDFRIKMEMDRQGIKQPILMSTSGLEALLNGLLCSIHSTP